MTPRKSSTNSPQDEMPEITQDTDTDSEKNIENELTDFLKDFSEDIILKSESSKNVTLEQVNSIMERIAKTKEIAKKTATLACAALFRKGAANAGAPDSMEVEIICPTTKITTTVTRYDIAMALQFTVGHKTVRKLAEALAPQMLAANLQLIKKNPLMDLKGDLANRINSKLTLRKEDPLTREEEVCCATYAQWMPNLNEMASSTRLKSLLDEDLNARRKRKNKPTQSKSKGNTPNEKKIKGNNPNDKKTKGNNPNDKKTK